MNIAELTRSAAIVNGDLKRQAHLLSIVSDMRGRVVSHCNRNQFHALILESLVSLDHLRHFSAASTAARRPEVHKVHFSSQLRWCDFLAREQPEPCLWRALIRSK